MLPFHFHIATEGVRSSSVFQIATLGFLFEIQIEITEERSGRAGWRGWGSCIADSKDVLVFHIKFKDKSYMKKMGHSDHTHKIKMYAEILNDSKENIIFQVAPPVKKNLIAMLNINAMRIQSKEISKEQ
jgi:hypothetical protein